MSRGRSCGGDARETALREKQQRGSGRGLSRLIMGIKVLYVLQCSVSAI